MNELETLKKLSAAARSGPAPPVDVTAGVLEAIASRPQPGNLVFPVFAVVSVTLAVAVGLLAMRAAAGPQDPLADILNSMAMVLP